MVWFFLSIRIEDRQNLAALQTIGTSTKITNHAIDFYSINLLENETPNIKMLGKIAACSFKK